MMVERFRPLQEAVDEVKRELQVRERCFRRWIGDGRVSATDAQDRYDRLASALEVLTTAQLSEAEAKAKGNGKKAAS